ncbi:MAG: alpha/beta hydrolase [Proteobacteria bacterium]|nr:alpha/beta hydrolase [Pseudomonadota bacterium]
MTGASVPPAPATTAFKGSAGNTLVADVFGERGPPVLLLHGGGQTRHAWRQTAAELARARFMAVALDQRGHGDSEWVAAGDYTFSDFAADCAIVAGALARGDDGRKPVVIGASLGGIAALLASGRAMGDGGAPIFAALVLVDVTPRVDMDGVAKIQGFMRAHAGEGFASIAEAADVVAAYLPHRPRPRSHAGLRKNLRLHADGRWRWHWDPRLLDGPRSVQHFPAMLAPLQGGDRVPGDRAALEEALILAARSLRIPALLVRGSASELVGEAHVREFLELVPHAEFADVTGARHMVAGDDNDRFSAAILRFLGNLDCRP